MIAAVKQVGNQVRVYNESGLIMFSKCGQCVGYTSETVSVKSNTGTTWTFDKTGRTLFGR